MQKQQKQWLPQTSMTLRDCRSRECLIQHTILDLVVKYVDSRAHLVGDELRYSIQDEKGKWNRASVLRSTDLHRIFGELYDERD